MISASFLEMTIIETIVSSGLFLDVFVFTALLYFLLL